VLANGATTYKAYVIAKEGTKPFGASPTSRARSRLHAHRLLRRGLRALAAPAGEKAEAFYTPSREDPSAGDQRGAERAADYAVVKNMVWDPAKFPGLALVGEDKGENRTTR